MRRISHLSDLSNRSAADLQGMTPVVQAITNNSIIEYLTPTTGFSITPASTTNTLILDPAGILASGTVNLPASPVDGQIFYLISTYLITALTVAPNVGQALQGLVSYNGYAGWVYRLGNTTWYRIS